MKQIIISATRSTSASESVIDHILVNNKEKITQSGVLPVGCSDHLIIYCTRKIMRGQMNFHNVIKIRSMKHFDKEVFNTSLKGVDWTELLSCFDVNMVWKIFSNKFIAILDQVAPIKQIRLKSRTEPWMSDMILENNRIRDKFLSKFRKNKNDKTLYKSYCKVRNKVQRDIKLAKSNYYSDKIRENKSNSKKLWDTLKGLGYRSTSKSENNIVLEIDDEFCCESNKVANHFNEFFTGVASQLTSKLPAATNKFSTDSEILKQLYRNKIKHKSRFRLKTISELDILKELQNVNIYKSTGLDNIPAKFIKDGAPALAPVIAKIINLSIDSNVVPDELKMARVKPLYKKNSRVDVGNYRPVSILNVISKILEKVVCIQLEKYLIENDILFEFQSGFRGGYSTETCLIHLTDYVRSQSAKGFFTGMVLLDLQKAIDTVDHSILCNKLKLMGVDSVEWFESYLGSRKQLVKVNGSVSELRDITCGVPQGSILGPLLFLCYINDLHVSVNCKAFLYADDTALMVSDKTSEKVKTVLGQELVNCNEWLTDNKLSLYLGKTESIIFGPRRKIKKVADFKINFSIRKLLCSALIQPHFDCL